MMTEAEVRAALEREEHLVNELCDSTTIVSLAVQRLADMLRGGAGDGMPIDALADQLERNLRRMEAALGAMTPTVRREAAKKIPEHFLRDAQRLAEVARKQDARVKLAMRQGGQA